jgi:hypothetical protein
VGTISKDFYTGVTGFMEPSEVSAGCAVAREAGDRPLMVGVLVSAKTLRGKTNRWPLRYPTVDRVADLFAAGGPNALNLIHYCDSTPPSWDTIAELREIGGPCLHGFQFNRAWPERETIGKLVDGFLSRCGEYPRIVLQVRPGFSRDYTTFPLGATDVLLDGSGGRGTPLDVPWIEEASTWFRQHLPCYKVGIAGGLDADMLAFAGPQSTIATVARLIRAGASTDAEGRLRDAAEGGGCMDMAKVEAYIRTVASLATSNSP